MGRKRLVRGYVNMSVSSQNDFDEALYQKARSVFMGLDSDSHAGETGSEACTIFNCGKREVFRAFVESVDVDHLPEAIGRTIISRLEFNCYDVAREARKALAHEDEAVRLRGQKILMMLLESPNNIVRHLTRVAMIERYLLVDRRMFDGIISMDIKINASNWIQAAVAALRNPKRTESAVEFLAQLISTDKRSIIKIIKAGTNALGDETIASHLAGLIVKHTPEDLLIAVSSILVDANQAAGAEAVGKIISGLARKSRRNAAIIENRILDRLDGSNRTMVKQAIQETRSSQPAGPKERRYPITRRRERLIRTGRREKLERIRITAN